MPNPFANTSLPSPRDLLTALFNSLPQTVAAPESGIGSSGRSNVLKSLSNAHRSLLGTLHVLFPSLFLPALDLLDRGLVTKVSQANPSTSERAVNPTGLPQAQITHHDKEIPGPGTAQVQREIENTIYLVHSAQPAHSRGGSAASRYGTAQGNSYIVRLEAWNCSCAAFAFSAFPGSTSGPFVPCLEESTSGLSDAPMAQSDWEFGGLSFNGTLGHGDVVPCCKHLMACLLAERWEGVLGGYVKMTRVGREEMAGLGADGGV